MITCVWAVLRPSYILVENYLGISVVCSAGNSGPYPQAVTNTAPWTITVAANTIDRAFPTMIIPGNNQTVVGQASCTGKDVNKFYPIVNGEDIAAADADEDSARSCDYGSLNATLARGKVVLCFQSQPQRSAAYAARAVLDIEGVGVIFAQFPTKDVTLFLGIPCVQVDFTIGTYLLTYMESTSLILLRPGLTSWPPSPLLLRPSYSIVLKINSHLSSNLNQELPWRVLMYLAL